MDAKTAIEKMRNKYRCYIKLDVWRSESARLMQLECDEIADFIEQQEKALLKINDIRNSIVGLQTINWSEHIYPLVAALNDAGIQGLGYPKSQKKFGTMLERTIASESQVAVLRGALEYYADRNNYLGDIEISTAKIDVSRTACEALQITDGGA